MESYVKQCRHLISQARTLLAGLGDEHLALEPRPGMKTAGWLIGHLVVSGDFARYLCGRKRLAPKEWGVLFSPGTIPSDDASQYPPMSQLAATCIQVYEDLCDAASAADPVTLAAPHKLASAAHTFPTAGDFASYLLSPHFAYHLGQLQAWRAAAGVATASNASVAVD